MIEIYGHRHGFKLTFKNGWSISAITPAGRDKAGVVEIHIFKGQQVLNFGNTYTETIQVNADGLANWIDIAARI